MIEIGLELCVKERSALLEGARFGLLMNQASVDHDWHYACDLLDEAYPRSLVALFSPQHGFWGLQQANMIESPHARHPRLNIPIYSLYSETRSPTPEMLDGLDCFVIDLQDVGTRVYTFIWTVKHCLEACAQAGIPVLVLDRPNPIGDLVEGPMLSPEYFSFVGEATIPMRHGLTLGELASLINNESEIRADLHIVPVRGWKRSMMWNELDRAWVPPSPNMPRWETALVYPGQVMLEGTNLSEGRGTTMPFEVIGAPYVDPERLVDVLMSYDLPGARFLPFRFMPTADKWCSQDCGGLLLNVTDPVTFRPVLTTIAILAAVARNHPDNFAWLDPPYEYETVHFPIDIISGSSQLRENLFSVDPFELTVMDRKGWAERVEPFLIYDRLGI